MSDKMFSVGLKLSQESLDALDKYRADKEQEIRVISGLSSHNLSRSSCAKMMIEEALNIGGYLGTAPQSKPIKKPIEQHDKPRLIKTRATDTVKPRDGSSSEKIRQEYRDGYTGTGADLARKYDVCHAVITRNKKAVQAEIEQALQGES